MGQFDNQRTVLTLKSRTKRLGLDLDAYIGRITDYWDETPSGFGFTYKDQNTYLKLMDALVQNPHFGSDTMLGGSQHRGASFREVNQPDSLHITVCRQPDRKSGATGTVHLDTVSPVLGKDEHGFIVYDQGKVLQHLATDLKHTPLIMPNSTDGIVFGVRF
jgi:hypothetical protein